MISRTEIKNEIIPNLIKVEDEDEDDDAVNIITYKNITFVAVTIAVFRANRGTLFQRSLKSYTNSGGRIIHPIIYIFHSLVRDIRKYEETPTNIMKYEQMIRRLLHDHGFTDIFLLTFSFSLHDENPETLLNKIQNVVNIRLLKSVKVYPDLPLTYRIKQEGPNCAMTCLIAGLTLFQSHGSVFSITTEELLQEFQTENSSGKYDELGSVKLSQTMKWTDEYPRMKNVDFDVLQRLSKNKVEKKERLDNTWVEDVVHRAPAPWGRSQSRTPGAIGFETYIRVPDRG